METVCRLTFRNSRSTLGNMKMFPVLFQNPVVPKRCTLFLFSNVVSQNIPSRTLRTSPCNFGPKSKAAKGPAKAAPASAGKSTTKLEKKCLKVEEDCETLTKHCCINFHLDQTDPGPELKEDEFYPDWLWDLDLTIKPWFELDPKTPGECHGQADHVKKYHC
jgi:hypothetical protein